MTENAVFSVGDSTHTAAQLVCQARGWPRLSAHNLEEVTARILCGNVSTAIVVADRKAVTASGMLRLSDTLARSRLCHAVSFLMGTTSSAIETMASRIPGRPSVEPNYLPKAMLVHPDFQNLMEGMSLIPFSTDITVGKNPVIGKDCAVLFLVGHSSGFDAGFENLAICRRGTGLNAPANFLAFPCFYGAPCRYDKPVLLPFSTDIVAARKVINITCWGFGLQDHMFQPELTVGQGLLDGGAVESMITSIRVFPLERSDLMALYYLINHGVPFGLATALANKLRLQRGNRADFFCFGDPEGYVECSNQEVECEWNGVTGLVTNLSSSFKSDIEIRFPKDIDQSDKIVLIGPDSAGMVCGVSTSGYVFLSPSNQPPTNEVLLRLLPADHPELAVLGSVKELLIGFHHLDHLARSLGCESDHGGGVEASRLYAALRELRSFLIAWPLSSLKGGDVLRSVEVSNAFTNLSSKLNSLGNAFSEMYWSLLGKGSPFLLLMGNDLGTSEAQQFEIDTCRYCGQAVDETLVSSWTGRPSRISGCCHICGPIYDVGPEDEKWISSDSVRLNSSNNFKINIRNAYPFPATAFSGLAIPPFGSQQAVSVANTILVPARQTRTINMDLDLSAQFHPGTYYVMGFAIIGTSLSLFRKPIVITE